MRFRKCHLRHSGERQMGEIPILGQVHSLLVRCVVKEDWISPNVPRKRRNEERRRRRRQTQRIYSGMILSFLTVSPTSPVSRPRWGIDLLLSPFPRLAISLSHRCIHSLPRFLSLSHACRLATRAITDVPFHQMRTKATLWASTVAQDPFNLRQHEGKWGQIEPGSTHSATQVSNELRLIMLIHLLQDEKSVACASKCAPLCSRRYLLAYMLNFTNRIHYFFFFFFLY